VTLLLVILAIGIIVSAFIFRFYISSVLTYLSVRLQRREKDLLALSSLREGLVHERKKKIAGLEMILSAQTGGRPPAWEKGEEFQARREYFDELLGQLKNLVRDERRDLMAVTRDIFLWGRLWSALRRLERISKQKREGLDFAKARRDLARIQELIDGVLEEATEKFSFTLNQVVEESVKIVRIEKSQVKDIEIKQQLDPPGDSIRFSYHRFKDWQRLLTNLIRNAVEAVEAKAVRGVGVAADFSQRGAEDAWVRISTAQSGPHSLTVAIEDCGIGMDEATRSSFFKKGYTSGKEHGLGLGVTEESIQFVEQYGKWEIESKKGLGTKITINIDQEKARKGELILPEERPFYRTRLAFGLYFLALGLVGLALLFTFDKYSRFWADWNPAIVKLLDENTITVETKRGRLLWNWATPKNLKIESHTTGDINRDGKNEVLISTKGGFKDTGRIHCLSFKGNELWQFTLGAHGVFRNPSDVYNADQILIRDLNLDGEVEIIVRAMNFPWFPCQIASINKRGHMRSSYWHPGAVRVLLCDDIEDDGLPEIVIGGVNNSLNYSAVLGILDYRTIRGQSPPYSDHNLPKAQERTYIKFPFVKGLGGENNKFSMVIKFEFAGKEDGQDVYKVLVVDHREIERVFWLNATLTSVLRIVVSPKSRYLWEQLKEEGILDYDITEKVIEDWKKIEVWKNGVKLK
jgi:signal transduction histidine kinase